jgi:membrane protease YdiL (CAAX protease family)
MTTTSVPARRAAEAAPLERRPRGELVTFLAVTFGLTAASTAVAVVSHADVSDPGAHGPLAAVALYGQAFWPLVGALVARLAFRRAVPGWGFRRAPRRALLGSWAYGAALPLIAALPLLATGVLEPDVAGLAGDLGLGGLPRTLGAVIAVLAGLTLGTLPFVVLAIGEEVGWRGVLVPHLAATGSVRRVVVVGGLVWAAFHLPLMTTLGGTPAGVPVPFAVACFTVMIVADGAVLAWARLRWGLWPVVVLHAAHNAVLYAVLEPGTHQHAGAGWLAGETGLLLAAAEVLGALLWLRRAPLLSRGGTVVAGVRE